MTIITYAEMAEIKENYEKLAKCRVGELPDTGEFDAWLREWAAKKGLPFESWAQFAAHVVPTDEHRALYRKEKN